MEDLEIYWPKIKEGGIMAGHDYFHAIQGGGQDWTVCMDGSRHPGGVKGAVNEFARKLGLTVVVCNHETSWLIRKPHSLRVIDESINK